MKIYLSGPMTGIPRFNFDLFDEVAAELRADMNVVFSPADNDRLRLAQVGINDITQVKGFAEGNVALYNEHSGVATDSLLTDDLNFILNEADAIVLLPGWEKSTGARWERTVAESVHVPILLAVKTPWGWLIDMDACQDRMTQYLRDFPTSDLAADLEAV